MPSVLVGQLRDYLDAGWIVAEPRSGNPPRVTDALTCQHPLQPFSEAYFIHLRPGVARRARRPRPHRRGRSSFSGRSGEAPVPGPGALRAPDGGLPNRQRRPLKFTRAPEMCAAS
jgi:hypothetical protein